MNVPVIRITIISVIEKKLTVPNRDGEKNKQIRTPLEEHIQLKYQPPNFNNQTIRKDI
ncbi:7390_t:CDS:2 [Funneliformis caledonium]|uniref:7390_t:CDS:1 n=1 Tax=Funneliformis caledonium TaxID=1117310 RepID=A0A9N8ZNM0_9GLOM|nr:7390_t:CDS:2 [Funneliformis caledonium]